MDKRKVGGRRRFFPFFLHSDKTIRQNNRKFTTNDTRNRHCVKTQDVGFNATRNECILISTNLYCEYQDVEKTLFDTCRKAPIYAIKLGC